MASLSARSLPVALALALMAGASFAQDRPNDTLVQKSKSSATAPKAKAQSAATVNGGATVKAGSKQSLPAETSSPATEKSYEGCGHGKASEA